jgi:hypothetical protein
MVADFMTKPLRVGVEGEVWDLIMGALPMAEVQKVLTNNPVEGRFNARVWRTK